MFDLRVFDLDTAKHWLLWASKIISTVSRNTIYSTDKNHLVVVFDDTENPEDIRCPTAFHINRILDFSKNLTDEDRLLVHCKAGRRRSPATSIGILIQHGMTIEEAFKHAAILRPNMIPNQLVLSLMDDALGLDGKLTKYSKNWIMK